MTTIKRSALALSAAALMGLSLSACGSNGGSSAPTNASQEDFCKTFEDASSTIDDTASDSDQADQAHKVADSLKKVGTPSDMSSDARQGFEIFVDFLGKVDASEVKKLNDSSSSSDNNPFSGDDKTKVEAFLQYTTTKCIPTGSPSDLPSVPTELPSQ
ncbi:MAG TPA: hypothetical protein VJ872_08885 [Nocardioides sp.]|nr:hypothetical protein [Nocardioides sp.]